MPLSSKDPSISSLISKERIRQTEGAELIASENYTSDVVMEAQGSILTNKYAEGLPRRRYYGGCEFVDEIECSLVFLLEIKYWASIYLMVDT
jgi:glycine hydroxymethyltransferase